MTGPSVHVRRLQSRVARTAARFVDQAARSGAGVADLPAMRLPWYTVRDQAAGDAVEPATVFVFDEIGGSFGVSAEDFARDLEDIDAPEIRVRINSPGGSVFDAIAIHNALRHHPARIVVYVDALAASAATVIAMAGDEIVMMPGSQMMIHDASAVEDGNAADMAKMSTFLGRQSDNIADLYRLRAGGTVAQWRELMLAETWMFAGEAVEFGLADRVEEPQPASDPELGDLMTRSHDLSQFRYAGRQAAPAPGTHRQTTTRPVYTRSRGAATTTDRIPDGEAAMLDRQQAAAARAEAAQAAGGGRGGQRGSALIPCGAGRSLPFAAQLRAKKVDRGGKQLYQLEGYATVYERGYEMWDVFGPYTEVVSTGAGARTLAANPDVAFLVNHRGVTMARTTSGTLELSEDATGLKTLAWLNPGRQDVKDLVIAIDDRDIDQMSFAFMITTGLWSPDFTEYRISEYDIDRGDVSAVNFGANPHTSIAARSREILDMLDHLPAGAARAALSRLQHRPDVVDLTRLRDGRTDQTPAASGRGSDDVPPKSGRSLSAIEALLHAD